MMDSHFICYTESSKFVACTSKGCGPAVLSSFTVRCGQPADDACASTHTLPCLVVMLSCERQVLSATLLSRIYKPKAAVPQNRRVVWGYNQTVTVGVLPVAMFANGHVFFTQKLYEVPACRLADGIVIMMWRMLELVCYCAEPGCESFSAWPGLACNEFVDNDCSQGFIIAPCGMA